MKGKQEELKLPPIPQSPLTKTKTEAPTHGNGLPSPYANRISYSPPSDSEQKPNLKRNNLSMDAKHLRDIISHKKM